MKKKHLNLTIVLVILSFFSFFSIKQVSAKEEEVITDGVYIDSVNIGGMTLEEAKDAVENYIEDLKTKTITVKVEDESEVITLANLGFTYEEHDYIEQARSIGDTGNLIDRYKVTKDISYNNLVFSLEFSLDDNLVDDFVETKLSVFNIEAQNATVQLEGGNFSYTDHLDGRSIQVEETIRLIEESIQSDWNKENINLDAIVLIEEAKYNREMLEKIDSVLGSYTTNYSSSSSSRAANLSNGARLVNNTVIYPGEEFNSYDILTPFTASNGYSVGSAYENGKVVDSIGGGACQVTTTLYNTALYAEMEITERAAHSMTVGYVPLARDAAIAGTYKNLRFANNTEYPILIQGYVHNRNITFKIWGHETRPSNRKVEFETVVLSERRPPADVVTEDSTQPTTYRKQTQSPHTGYVTELYKVEIGRASCRERV